MVDKIPAYNALLAIRETAQEQMAWIDDMVAASEKIASIENAGAQIVCSHLVVMKQIITTQDAIITQLMRSVEQSDDFMTEIKKKFNLE